MKYSILNLFLCLCLTLSSNAQDILFEENFEDGIPATFNLFDVDGANANANVSQYQGSFVAGTLGGQACAISTSWLEPVGITDDWMITPSVTIENTPVYLTFSALAIDPNFPDGVEVYISTTGQDISDFEGIDPVYSTTTAGEASEWTTRSIDLSDYDGQSVYVAFRNNSNDDYLLGIDNIKFKSLAANDAQLSSATIDSPLEGNRTVDVQVTNGGSNAITSFSIDWSLSGDDYNESVNGINLSTGQSTTVQLELGDLTEGAYAFSAEVNNVNNETDPEMSDNTIDETFNIVVPVPDFNLTDSYGNDWRLYDELSSGKMVVLDFFASWCGPCASSTPELNTMYVENEEQLNVFGITIEAGDNTAASVNSLGWGGTYPKFSYTNDGRDQYVHYASTMGLNVQGSIPFFVMICPNTSNLAYSDIVVSEVGFLSGMFTNTFVPQINQCSAVSSIEEDAISNYTIYPNPIVSTGKIELTLSNSSLAEINIVDILGKTVQSSTHSLNSGNNVVEFDVNNLSNGVYFVKVNAEGKTSTQKITVTK